MLYFSYTDTLYGGLVNDTLIGKGGNDTFYGGTGNDMIYADKGDDNLNGGADDDVLYGGDGNDILNSGTGNDILIGGAGADIYIFNKGDGQDRIYNEAHNTDNTGILDTIQFGKDISKSDIQVTRVGNDLVLIVKDSNINNPDSVTIRDYFLGNKPNDQINNQANNQIRQVVGNIIFADGSQLSIEEIKALAITGTDANDELKSYAGGSNINGDTGADTYIFNKGDGQDIVINSDSDTAEGTQDSLNFNNVNYDQLWFSQTGNDLNISIIGTDDKVKVEYWYTEGYKGEIDSIHTSDNKALIAADVDKLIQAMASFSPPPMGQTTLTSEYQDSLNSVLVANWK
ncbi:MAG: hypothetical protein RLZZ210_1687 [Pseudomonadota bacterium]